MKRFSFFEAPIVVKNASPSGTYTLKDVYKCVTGQYYQLKIATLRSITGNAIKAYKIKELDYVTFSGIFSVRNSTFLVEHSGYLCLDFDGLQDPEESKQIIANDKNVHPLLLFISPSGHGLKVVVPINLDYASQEEYVECFAHYFLNKYGIKVDTICKDVCRGCFLSYDPDAIYHGDNIDRCFDPRPYLHNKISTGKSVSDHDDIERLIDKIRSSHIDITPTYETWRNVGFGLADKYGEYGREYYHQLSQYYPRYTREETDKQYTACLRSNGTGITIASVFQAAKDAGIDISLSKNRSAHLAHLAHDGKNKDEIDDNLSTIPDDIFLSLPQLLKDVVSRAQDAKERDVCLLSAMAIISAALPHINGVYDGKVYFPHLYVIIEGRASSGKGRVAMLRRIGDLIHRHYKDEYEEEMVIYRKDYREWTEGGMVGPEPKEPRLKLFYIPANSSSAALCRQLADNNGEAAIIDTEVDTVVNAFNSDYGNYSEILRKAAHHETISLRRKTNNELIEIELPKIALCLSGTPGQVIALMGSGEDGLFSRVAFYHLPLDLEWRDPFKEINNPLDTMYKHLGDTFYYQYYNALLSSPESSFSLTRIQQDKFNQVFASILCDSYNDMGVDIIPTVHRLGLICFRLAMILTVLQRIEKSEMPSGVIACDDDSFRAALEICKVLLAHDMYVYSELPRSAKQFTNRNRMQFLSALPPTFNRQTYHTIALSLGLNVRTVDRYIRQLLKEGKIERTDLGNYKINVKDNEKD